MKKLWLLLALLPALAFGQVAVKNLPSGTVPASADYGICDQSGTTNKCTYSQIAASVSALLGLTPWATANYPALVASDCLGNNGTTLLWVTCGSGGGGSGTVTSVSVSTSNGLGGTVTNPTTTPQLILFPTFTGISYATGTGFQAAVAANFPTLNQSTTGNAATSTSLAALPSQCSGSQFAQGIAANGNANCSTPAGSGTVTTVSVASTNGYSGTVANPTTTPAITLNTTFTGIGYSTSGSGWATAIAANFPTLNQSTTGNAATSTAFASTPTGCTGGQFATSQATNGNFTCATPSSGNALTATEIGFGSAGNVLTGSTNLLWTDSTQNLTFGTGASIITGAAAGATSVGRGLSFNAGTGGSTSGAGGALQLAAGSGNGTSSGNGGQINLSGGTGSSNNTTGTSNGGSALWTGGAGGTATTGTANGGGVTISGGLGGTAATTNAAGGSATVAGGAAGAASNSNGGGVTIQSGAGNGTGVAGSVLIQVNAETVGNFVQSAGHFNSTLGDSGFASSVTNIVGGSVANTQANGSPILTLASGGNITVAPTISSNGICLANGTNCPAGSGVTLQTNGTNNTSQTTLNIQNGAGIAVTNPSAGNVTVALTYVPRLVSGTSDTILSTDCGSGVEYTSSSAIAITLPQATGSFAACSFDVIVAGSGTATVTPTTSTITNGSSLTGATLVAPGRTSVNITGLSGNYVSQGTALLPSSVNTWTAQQNFTSVYGASDVQSGATYTLPASDCGGTFIDTDNSAVTVTIPASIVPASGTTCNITVIQGGTAKISVNGSAVTAATLLSASSFTGTSGTKGAMITLTLTTFGATTYAVLSGNGS